MKIFATYRDPVGDELEVSSGLTELGTHRVRIASRLTLASKAGRQAAELPDRIEGAHVYLSRAQALDFADAVRRAALELPKGEP